MRKKQLAMKSTPILISPTIPNTSIKTMIGSIRISSSLTYDIAIKE